MVFRSTVVRGMVPYAFMIIFNHMYSIIDRIGMITGVETAGLAFPLAIECLKVYSSGVRTIKDIRNYRWILTKFERQLRTESCKFENMCLGLLEDMVTPEVLGELMANPGGKLWFDPEFQEKLRQRLGPARGTLENWLETVCDMHEMLEEVATKFKVDKSNKPSERFEFLRAWKTSTLKAYRDETLVDISRWNDDLCTLTTGGNQTASSSRYVGRLSPSKLTQYHKRVQTNAKTLYYTLKEKLEHPECKCGAPHGANLELEVRNADTIIVSGPKPTLTFKLLFSAEPIVSPSTAINWQAYQLERVDENEEYLPENGGFGERVGFRVNVTSPPSLDATTASSECEKPQSTRRHGLGDDFIKSELLSFIRKPATTDQPALIAAPCDISTAIPERPSSRLSFKSLIKYRRRTSPHPQPSLLIPDQPTGPGAAERTPQGTSKRVSFHDVTNNNTGYNPISEHNVIECFCTALTTNACITSTHCLGLLVDRDAKTHRVWLLQPAVQIPTHLVSLAGLLETLTEFHQSPTLQARLVLGIKLVSSVMQLSTTEWLQEGWSAHDIMFLCDGHPGPGILSRPLIHRQFNTQQNQRQSETSRVAVVGCNQNLYGLGIVLMELWLWRTFGVLNSRKLPNNGSTSSAEDYLLARELAARFHEQAGPEYGDAVRRCIFGLDTRISSLENDEFRKEVYLKVVYPLEENLKRFCGRGLEEIFRTEECEENMPVR